MWNVHWVVARFLVVCGTRSIVRAVLDLSGGGGFLRLKCGFNEVRGKDKTTPGEGMVGGVGADASADGRAMYGS